MTLSLAFVIVATMLVQALTSMGLLGIAFMGPLVAGDLGLPPEIVGLQVGFTYLWSALASPLAGAVVMRFGPARASQAALLACALGLLACASGSLALIVLGSALAGAGYSLTNPAASHILNRRAPARYRNLVFAIKQSGVPVGWALAGVLMPALAVTAGWQAGLVVAALAMLAHAAVLEPAAESWRDRPATGAAVPLRSFVGIGFWGDRTLLALAVAGFLFATTQTVVVALMVTALVEEAGWSPVAAGSAVAVMQVSGTVGRLVLAAISDRHGAGLATLLASGLGSGIAALFCGAVLLAGNPALVLSAIAVLGFFAIAWNGVMLAEFARLCPAERVGAATARLMMFYYSGAILGPWAFSLLFTWTLSYAANYAWFALAAFGGAAAVLAAMRMQGRLAPVTR